jgi:hypothetical protein
MRLTSPARGPSPLSPARQALAKVIAAIAENQRQIAALSVAIETAWSTVSAAEAAVTVAQDAMAQAQRNAATYLVDQALGVAGDAPKTIQSARAELLAAEDNLAASKAARDALTTRFAEEQKRPERLTVDLAEAARTVVRVEAADATQMLAAEVVALQRQLIDQAYALSWLVSQRRMIGEPPAADLARDAELRLYQMPASWDLARAPDASLTLGVWRAAFETLKTDPTAPLPT